MTKEIQLTKGMTALVDDEWYEYLSQWKWYAGKWNNGWYAVRRSKERVNGKRPMVCMHRVVANAPDGMFVDHVDRNPLNNTSANLRICDYSKNNINKALDKRNTTGYKGVCPVGKRFKASIGYGNENLRIGLFDTPEEAAAAYNEKAKELFGPFAWLNPLPSR